MEKTHPPICFKFEEEFGARLPLFAQIRRALVRGTKITPPLSMVAANPF